MHVLKKVREHINVQKLGIMQPYFLPYLGYWQLINAVDRFILLDDVAFIKQGFIHKNLINSQGKPQAFNLQINAISSNKRILEHELSENSRWRSKLIQTIKQNYSKAPFFSSVFPMLEAGILNPERNLAAFLADQITQITEFLQINTEIVRSSELYEKHLSGQDRIIGICKNEGAEIYINAIGGQQLYSKEAFSEASIELLFIKSSPVQYAQWGDQFVPNLSIVDVLMFNSTSEITHYLNQFELV